MGSKYLFLIVLLLISGSTRAARQEISCFGRLVQLSQEKIVTANLQPYPGDPLFLSARIDDYSFSVDLVKADHNQVSLFIQNRATGYLNISTGGFYRVADSQQFLVEMRTAENLNSASPTNLSVVCMRTGSP